MPRPRRLYLPPPESEQRYLNLLLDPLDACAHYKPKLGTEDKKGVSLEQFKRVRSRVALRFSEKSGGS